MFRVSPHEIKHLQGAGGELFTSFVDHLIRAEAYASGVPDVEIRTNLKTTEPDGGVDTQVRVPIPGERTGRFRRPTIWQYKTSSGSKVAARSEIRKGSYAAKLIKEGYAYRLCICDELSPRRAEALRHSFANRIRTIKPGAPEPEIVTADDLAAWATRFPGVVLHHFYRDIGGQFLTFDAWRRGLTAVTSKYVRVTEWEDVTSRIGEHIDFGHEVPEAVLSLRGESGVGKSRLVSEVVAAVDGASELVVYTDDDDTAMELAHRLAREQASYAILVVDECSLQARERLEGVLQAVRDRVRSVAIDNASEPPPGRQRENKLEKVSDELVDQILERNFPDVLLERRKGYAALSRGHIRFAAELCLSDKKIAPDGYLGPVLSQVERYLYLRLPDDEDRRVVEAASLLTRAGWRDDVAQELNSLCQIVGIAVPGFRRTANRLHNSPGFVGRGGRYYYVAPEIVARAAFGMAWQRWAAADPEAFLVSIPGVILQQFLERVARSAPNDVRELVSSAFANWATAIQPAQLADLGIVHRLVALVEMDPAAYLPLLRRLVEQASEGERLAVTGDGWNGQWGPRRQLVWLAERMAAFPEYFADAEAILLHLALAESEPRVANNATSIWKQLFRIFLSGTAVPFWERLPRLTDCVFSTDDRVSALALNALEANLEPHVMRMSGPLVVAGRVRPQDWHPVTTSDHAACVAAAVDLLVRAATSDVANLNQRARAAVMKRLWQLLEWRHLDALKSILPATSLDDATRAHLVSEVADYLDLHTETADAKRRLTEDHLREIESWLGMLTPSDLHSRLVVAVSKGPWQYLPDQREQQWRAELHQLAAEAVGQPGLLSQELGWLCSPDAKGAAYFGDELAQLDSEDALLDQVFGSVLEYGSALLARGYALGSIRTRRDRIPRINEWIARVECESPSLAYDLFIFGLGDTRALARTLRLVDAGGLPATHLAGFTYGDASLSLTVDHIAQVLVRLLRAVERRKPRADSVALEFVAMRLHHEGTNPAEPALKDPAVRALVWCLLELTITDAGHEPYSWREILRSLSQEEPARVARMAAAALASSELILQQHAEKLLTELAGELPEVVMSELGAIMLDSERGMHFHIAVHRGLISALPPKTVIAWLEEHGVEAARRVGRHLPLPHLGPGGKPVVPPLTEFVLTRFEDDDWTFSEFCAGVHSFQTYTGDIARQHEQEAELARRFLGHQARRVREWAGGEMQQARSEAQRAREREEEFGID